MARRIIIPFLILSLILLAACSGDQCRRRTPSISMAGMADTLVVPDLVVWTLSMEDLDEDLPKAKESNDSKLKSILEAIEKVDLIESSLRSGTARIEMTRVRCDDRGEWVHKFKVYREVSFHQDDPAGVDRTLDHLVSSADITASCFFDLSDPDSIMKELRKRALDQARDKAVSLADHAGLGLGEILGFNLNEEVNPYRRQRHMRDQTGQVSGPQAQYLHTQVRVNFKTE
jgi:uncharacterized protein YggE